MFKKLKIAITVAVVVMVFIIALQNRESVETKLLFASVTMPRAALLFVSFTLGFGCGVLAKWSIVSQSTRDKTAREDG